MRRFLCLSALLAAVLTAATCDQGVSIPSDGLLTPGTWGGDNAGVIVTEAQAHVHIGCTFGDMPGRVELDQSGRFTVDGSYVLRAYPIQLGPSLPAQFSGKVNGSVLTLAVAVNDTVEKKVVALGPITVVYGRNPNLGPCPICVVPRKLPASPAAAAARSVAPLPSPPPTPAR
jgi:hypothetical protein